MSAFPNDDYNDDGVISRSTERHNPRSVRSSKNGRRPAQSADSHIMNEIAAELLTAIGNALGSTRSSNLLSNGSGVMRFVASRNLPEDYRQAVEGHSPWTRRSTDPQPVWVGDVDHADLKVTVKAKGIGALAFVPSLANRVLARLSRCDCALLKPHLEPVHEQQ